MNTDPVETLRWREGAIEMIDQRLLPARFVYVACHSALDVAAAIRDMVIRGAPAIGCAAAYGIGVEALRLGHQGEMPFARGMDAAFEVLAASRPTAVNLSWALARMKRVMQACASRHPQDVADLLIASAHEIRAEDIRVNRTLGAHGALLLADGARVLTHCNAGALAAAGHGTALGVIRSAIEAGKRISVIANETRPFLQGARLTAWELRESNIPVTLITDGMSGHLMARGSIDAVIVGADRVAANGDVANKIGTYMVATMARRHGIPFYVACPSSTIDMSTRSGADIPIEERSPHEVTGYGDTRWAPDDIEVFNPAFDVTPAELVSALITEKGVIHAPDPTQLKATFQS